MSKFQFNSYVIQPLGDEWLHERRKTAHGNSQGGGEENQKRTSGVKTLPKNRKCLCVVYCLQQKRTWPQNVFVNCLCTYVNSSVLRNDCSKWCVSAKISHQIFLFTYSSSEPGVHGPPGV
jgi:hypothetical protein